MVKYLDNYGWNEQVVYSIDTYKLFGTKLPDLPISMVFSWEKDATGLSFGNITLLFSLKPVYDNMLPLYPLLKSLKSLWFPL